MYELIGIICLIAAAYAVWQRRELKKFQITHYEMTSAKIPRQIKIAVLSDLHAFSYGGDNEKLVRAVFGEKPDLILIPGDLIVTSVSEKYETAGQLVQKLCAGKAPVFFTNGNHETRAEMPDTRNHPVYWQYRRKLLQAGLVILNNKSCKLSVNGAEICVSGLELPMSCYKKGKKPFLEETYIESRLGKADEECLQLLLAHHPAFAPQYAAWGADLAVCGHNHGGLVRIPGAGSVISPQFMLFPKYDAGEFSFGGRKVFVSRGLGTHTFHVRIFNRAELMIITVKPEKEPDAACSKRRQGGGKYGFDGETGEF